MDTQPLRDLIEALELRRLVALTTFAGVVLAGLVLAYLAPGILPPHPLVGAAVGLAALTIGGVAAVAADAGDETVRGSRHVRATGAVVAAEGDGLLDELVAWAEHQAVESSHLSLAVVGAGAGDASAARIASTIGGAIARSGRRVLVADLATEAGDGPGVAEVGRGEEKLSKAVTFSTEVDLARVTSGRPLTDALVALPRIAPRLQGDVEVLVAALPGLRQPGTLLAATAATRSLLLVTAGRTSRVDVIAGLQALDAAQAPADIVIVPEDGVVGTDAAPPAATEPAPVLADDPGAEPDPASEPEPTAEVESPDEVGMSDEVEATEEEVPPLLPDAEDEFFGSEDLESVPFEGEDDWTEPLEPVVTDEGLRDEQEEPWEEPRDEPRDEPRYEQPALPDPSPSDDPPGSRVVASGPPAGPVRETGGLHEELQRIASVIALERELTERDDEADGVA